MLDFFASPEMWASLITLTVMEIVLGIDNLLFISILSGRLPVSQQPAARRAGLAMAIITRILLLSSIAWIAGMTKPLFSALGHDISLRDLVLLGGGLFLLYKGTHEIHKSMDLHETPEGEARAVSARGFAAVVVQIGIFDIIFSFDSVITAVGMANQLAVMVAAVVLAMMVMMAGVNVISDFIDSHPTVKMLALSFLLLIGVSLTADGLGFHIPRGYVYFSMAFSAVVETLNLMVIRRRQPA